MGIVDIQKSQIDEMGETVLTLYGFKPPSYAVYATETRVTVRYADDQKENSDQRRRMAPLNPVRGEINGLIDGWRSARVIKGMRRKARHYDRRVADALVVALEDDINGAQTLLSAIKQDIVDERTAWARLEYLAWALLLSLVAIFLAIEVASVEPTVDLGRAASAGAVGAFFSTALAIRRRTILTDLHRTSNNMDAALRITIGIIAAVVLMALVSAQFIKFPLGDPAVGASVGNATNKPWLLALIIGFVAGFSERLVPDLLSKAGTDAQTSPAPILQSIPPGVAGGDKTPAPNRAADTSAETPDPLPQEAGMDHCLCDIDVSDDEATPDEHLPATTGGIAPAAPVKGNAP